MSQAEREIQRLANAQRRLLTQAAPRVPGDLLSLSYRPASYATGDYHDFFDHGDGRTSLFLGDGSGHGPAASILVATMRTIMHTHPELHFSCDPGSTLTAAGQMFHAVTVCDLFMTGLYLLLDEEGVVRWASAGQDPPFRVTPQGVVAEVDLTPVGMPMGIDAHEKYSTVNWQLGPGERLILFTDGLVDALDRHDNPFGRERLGLSTAKLAQSPLSEMVNKLVNLVIAHQEGADFEDDFTIIAIQRTQGSEIE
jgi:sigma-B regulation protein RsbU (phosphoserine phosphatase)